MEKRYQIFISSTFRDLQEERQAVLKTVLELNHMPAGMELFPATDENAWQLIKDVIDASDYYVLIIAGRYGSIDETGLGYTEKEYDYAVSANKPVIALLYKNPEDLPRAKTETDTAAWRKLEEFRLKVEKKHTCDYWLTSDELRSKIVLALTSIIKKKPAVGWIRADLVPDDATLSELLRLRSKIVELEKETEVLNTRPAIGSEDLLQGEDIFKISCSFVGRKANSEKRYTTNIKLTWDQIFACAAPCLINEAPERKVREAFERYFEDIVTEIVSADANYKNMTFRFFSFNDSEIDTCLVQLRALGLIKESKKARSLKDTSTYWTLTPYGDMKMVQLRALRKKATSEGIETEVS